MEAIQVLTNIVDAWESFCFNYRSTRREWHGERITVPEFIFKIEWHNVDADYMCSRWLEDSERYHADGSALVHIFYLGLDHYNKAALLRYANIIKE